MGHLYRKNIPFNMVPVFKLKPNFWVFAFREYSKIQKMGRIDVFQEKSLKMDIYFKTNHWKLQGIKKSPL